MTKEPPILAVNKPARNRKTPASHGKKSSSPRPSAGRKRKKESSARKLPSWLSVFFQVLIVIVFIAAVYFFFFRPYAYRWKPCYGCKEYGVCMPAGYTVHGFDLSHYQGDIDWTALSANLSGKYPLRFVFIKATEGGDHSDERFLQNFEAARAHGYIRGAYHFYNPETSPVKQADFFIRSVQLQPGDLPPVLDIEKTGRKNKDNLRRDLKIWLDRVEEHYGVKPILYTSYKFKNKYLNDSVFDSYPYWIAHYYVDSVRYRGQWKFWQHTDVGSLPGIKEEVDLNIFNGSLEELMNLTVR